MHAVILQRYTGDVDGDLSSVLGDGFPAADVESTQYLDGRTIHHGQLAAEVTDEERVPSPGSDGIQMVQEDVTRRVVTDFYADFDTEWVGAATGDGSRILADYLLGEVGIVTEDSKLRGAAWAKRLEQQDDAHAWAASFSQSIEDGHGRNAAGAHYHDEVGPIPRGLSAVGFEYYWDGTPLRGMLASSGYVALYTDVGNDTFARWIADEIEPYLEVDRGQETLGPECERCGRDSDQLQDGLCVVCHDRIEERGDV